MSVAYDVGLIALGLAVAGLFVWYFWHTASVMVRFARRVVDFWDLRAERQRRKLDHEAIRGTPPLWYRTVRKLLILAVIAGSAALVWVKFRGA